MDVSKATAAVVAALLATNARQALKVISPTEVVQATRLAYDGKFIRQHVHIVVTAGRPNYLARRFILACKKAGELFPVKKIQLRYLPKRAG